jgi:tetratricopeptide (TPR) repeat protein
VRIHNAYAIADEADGLMNDGRQDDAARLYQEASELVPDNHELRFWAGLGAAQGGDIDGGVEHVRAAIEMHPQWRDLLERLPAEFAPSAAAVLERLRAQS